MSDEQRAKAGVEASEGAASRAVATPPPPPPSPPPPPASPAGAVPASQPSATTGTAPAADTTHSDAAADLQKFFAGLLRQQCELTGAAAGVIYLVATRARNAGIAAVFPASGIVGGPVGGPENGTHHGGAPAPPPLDRTTLARMERVGAAAAAAPDRRGAVETATLGAPTGFYQGEPTHRIVACPLIAAEQVHGASVVLIPASVRPAGAEARPTTAEALERLRLTMPRYESYLWQQQALGEAHAKARLRETLELLDTAGQGGDAETMGGLFCHELARRFGATRVSIGLLRRAQLRLAAVSGADELDRRGAAAEAVEAAMEECADQDLEIVHPAPPEMEADPAQRRIGRAHAALSARFGPAAILSLPLRVEGDLVGVVLLERDAADPFPPGAVPLLRLIAEFIGPALHTRRLADRGLLAVARDRFLDLAVATVGPRHTAAKALALAAVFALAALAAVPIPSRIAARAETKASVSRTVPPPFTGYINEIAVKPGDTVAQGGLLARMDLRDLELELAKNNSLLDRLRTQQDDARSAKKLGDVQVVEAQMAEARAQVQLLQSHIARGEIRAPMAGVVSRGDLEPLAGASVDPGTPLLEIIDPASVVAVLDVDERDIGRVHEGQEGWVSLTAFPGERVPATVARIRPAAEPVRGANVYRVEVVFTDRPAWVKPGMTGTARLKDGWTTGLVTLMRPLVDKARLNLWW